MIEAAVAKEIKRQAGLTISNRAALLESAHSLRKEVRDLENQVAEKKRQLHSVLDLLGVDHFDELPEADKKLIEKDEIKKEEH